MKKFTKSLLAALLVCFTAFGIVSCKDEDKKDNSESSVTSEAVSETSEATSEAVSETSEGVSETSEVTSEEVSETSEAVSEAPVVPEKPDPVVTSEHLGLIAMGTQDSIDLSALSQYETLKIYKVNCGNENELPLEVSGSSFAIPAQMKGEYMIAGYDEEGNGHKIFFDLYNPTAGFEYSAGIYNLSPRVVDALENTQLAEAQTTPEGASNADAQYFEITSSGTVEGYNFSWAPFHSKAYYEQYADDEITITFEYSLVSATNAANATKVITGVYGGELSNNKWKKIYLGEWYQVEISLSRIIERWGTLANYEGMLIVTDQYFHSEGSPVFGDNVCTESKLVIGNFKLNNPNADVVSEAPAVSEEAPAVSETPAVSEMPAVSETPATSEAASEAPMASEAPAISEVPAVSETPVVSEEGTSEEVVVPEEETEWTWNAINAENVESGDAKYSLNGAHGDWRGEVTYEVKEGKAAYKVASTNSATDVQAHGLYLAPARDKAYYEGILAQDANAVVKVSFWFDEGTTFNLVGVCGNYNLGAMSVWTADSWNEVSVSLAKLIANWDVYTAGSNTCTTTCLIKIEHFHANAYFWVADIAIETTAVHPNATEPEAPVESEEPATSEEPEISEAPVVPEEPEISEAPETSETPETNQGVLTSEGAYSGEASETSENA